MPSPPVRWLSGALDLLHRLVEIFVVLLFVAMLGIGLVQIVNRYMFGFSISWSEEFQRFAHIWLVFLAVGIGYRRGVHIGLDLLQNALKPAMARVLVFVIDIGWLVLGSAVVMTALRVMEVASRQRAPALRITMDNVYLGLCLAGAYLVIVALSRIAATLWSLQRGEES